MKLVADTAQISSAGNMKPPAITAVIPTFRRPALLRRAIRSVLSQTREDLILTIYDNASGDGTPAVVSEEAQHDPRVRYHCHPENIGAIRNFDYGMRRVGTPYFSLLSDDDLILPHFYEEAIAALEREPAARIFIAPTIIINTAGAVVGFSLSGWEPGLYKPPAGLYGILRRGLPWWTSTVFRREVISEMGSLDCAIQAEPDRDYLIRAAARYPILISAVPGAVFFFNPEAESRRLKISQIWADGQLITEKIKAHVPGDWRAQALSLFERDLECRLFHHGQDAAMNGQPQEGLMAANLLESHFGAKAKAARLEFLVSLRRLRLILPVRLAARMTRSVRHPRVFLVSLRQRPQYQQTVDRVLRELNCEPARAAKNPARAAAQPSP